MTELNQKHLDVIRKLLQLKPSQTRLNKTLEVLHEHYSIGEKMVHALRFRDADFVMLRTLYDKHRKDDVLDKQLRPEGRMDAVNVYTNEKFATKAVFADQLIFASVNHVLPLKQIKLPIGFPSFVPTIRLCELDVSGIECLVVVENPTLLIELHRWYHLLPSKWQKALFLYRGHGKNQTDVKMVLSKIGVNVPVAIYPDFDPAGLAIVVRYAKIRPVSLIFPKCWPSLHKLHKCNLSVKFLDQIGQHQGLASELENHFELSVMFMAMQRECLAVMQENVLLLGQLEIIELEKFEYVPI